MERTRAGGTVVSRSLPVASDASTRTTSGTLRTLSRSADSQLLENAIIESEQRAAKALEDKAAMLLKLEFQFEQERLNPEPEHQILTDWELSQLIE